jgi:CubicO group peptidase (beta-lactamase class C family)
LYHPYYKNTKLHSIQSISKSITSLLFGVAIQLGDIKKNIDRDLIRKYFTKYDHYFVKDKWKSKIKIKHLFTMTSGINVSKKILDQSNPKHPFHLMEKSGDWVDFILNNKVSQPPGDCFEYKDYDAVLLSYIFREITSYNLDEYAKKYLFPALNIKSFFWRKTSQGLSDSMGGLYLSMDSLYKIGEMVIDKGKYNGKQLVSDNWLSKSVKNYRKSKGKYWGYEYGYGYYWWKIGDAIFAWGIKGQYLFILPKKNVIAVLFQWNNKKEIYPPDFYQKTLLKL